MWKTNEEEANDCCLLLSVGFLLLWDPEEARAAKQTYGIVKVLPVFTYFLSGPIQFLDSNHPQKQTYPVCWLTSICLCPCLPYLPQTQL